VQVVRSRHRLFLVLMTAERVFQLRIRMGPVVLMVMATRSAMIPLAPVQSKRSRFQGIVRWRIGRSASIGRGKGPHRLESVNGYRIGVGVKGKEGRFRKVRVAHEHDAAAIRAKHISSGGVVCIVSPKTHPL
jgi:hypothetical protein